MTDSRSIAKLVRATFGSPVAEPQFPGRGPPGSGPVDARLLRELGFVPRANGGWVLGGGEAVLVPDPRTHGRWWLDVGGRLWSVATGGALARALFEAGRTDGAAEERQLAREHESA